MNEVSPGRQRRHTFWRLWKADCIRICWKEKGQDWSRRDVIFQMSEPAWVAVTAVQGEASVPNKFHDHSDHVLVRQKFQQLSGDATMPDNVISSCQIDKHGTGLFFASKESSMFCVSKTTWPTVDFPCQNLACFFGSKGSTIDCRSVVQGSCKGRRTKRWDHTYVSPWQVLRTPGSRLPELFSTLSKFWVGASKKNGSHVARNSSREQHGSQAPDK